MLLKRLKLINYGGIYNGLGLYEIEIDFTKCTHRIVLIKGDNGSGKSTIESALKPLPDDSMSFIPGMTGVKEIDYYDEVYSTTYCIRYIHECKKDGRTTKGYFSKILPDGSIVDMNPSGNITACKDLIQDELELDPNYITLTQLSSTKRGIADLKPSDRKRFVNNILASTDVYNTMYKNLSKKSSHYKSLMTNISSKIDNIGNVAQLEEELKLINSQITDKNGLLDQSIEIINKEKGMLLSIDPDNTISERIKTMSDQKDEYTKKKDECNKQLNHIYTKNPSLSTAIINQDILDKLQSDITECDYTIKSLNEKISMLISSREKDASNLEDETAKLNSVNAPNNIIELEQIKTKLNSQKHEIEGRWGEIVDLNTITGDEFMIAHDVINNLYDLSKNAIIIPEKDINTLYLNTIHSLEDIQSKVDDINAFRDEMQIHEYKLDILSQRPESCKDDTCPFISDALKAKEILDNTLARRKEHKASLIKLKEDKDKYETLLSNIEINKQLLSIYSSNAIVLRKLMLNMNTYDECMYIIKNDMYNTITTINNLIKYTNDLSEYKTIEKGLSDIENKYNAYNTQKSLIDMITLSIDKLNIQIDRDTKEIEELNNQISINTNKYNEMTTLYNSLTNIYSLRIELNDYEDKLSIIQEEINKDKSNIEKISQLNADIDRLNVNIDTLRLELDPLCKSLEDIKYKLSITSQYIKEYNEYNQEYTKIETLKYYCSPTTGIQLIYANMYLNKIMENANNILSRLFGGVFALLPLVITPTEFRIPVAVNGGLNHDDITSMSSAQVALISMIISISLLSQTSTKLNIIVGDEIDAPFDSENRREFLNILLSLMGLVNSSQCVLISHNSEIPMSECDVILLRCDNDIITDGNIIWSYK